MRKLSALFFSTCFFSPFIASQTALSDTNFRMPMSMFTIIGNPGISPGENSDTGNPGNGQDESPGQGNGSSGDGGSSPSDPHPSPSINLATASTFTFELGTPITSIDFRNYASISGTTQTTVNSLQWNAIGGSMPPGLSLTGSVLSGVPSAVNTYNLQIQAQAQSIASTTQTYTIVVNGISLNILSMDIGETHTCAVTTSGELRCWGSNSAIGHSLMGEQVVPYDTGARNVKQVSNGYEFTCVLTNSGAVQCVGNGAKYQLGNGSNQSKFNFGNVTGMTSGVRKIELGYAHACGITSSYTVKCWGDNSKGQIGNGSSSGTVSSSTNVTNLTNVVDIALGQYHTCALKDNGDVYCWGDNSGKQIGPGVTGAVSATPNLVGNYPNATKIYSADATVCILETTGNAKCWGSGTYSTLGTGSNTSISTPTNVVGVSNFTSLSAGKFHMCGVTSDNNLYCWGYGNDGAILGNTTSRPRAVATLSGSVTEVHAGGRSTCVETYSGLKCIGSNTRGQLGNGNTNNQNTFIPVEIGN